jgi:hypothetical protein
MKIVPLLLRRANDFVERYHRHSARTSNDGGKRRWTEKLSEIPA